MVQALLTSAGLENPRILQALSHKLPQPARQIRALDRPDAGQVAIVAVTANAFAEDLAATAAAGMDAHISKPIDWEALRATLERLLANR